MNGGGEVTYRLPTEAEWIRFAYSGLNPNERIKRSRDSLHANGCPMFNYAYKNPCDRFMNNSLEYPRQIGGVRFMTDENNAYDVYGNVSEMVAEAGVSKGGNYLTPASNCHIDSIQHYTKPEKWLGFRCVAVKNGRINLE